MIRYILETIIFQLVFLLVYDMFLKKETFFQWNRAYLLITFAMSLTFPFVQIEALKTTISREAIFYPEFLWQNNLLTVTTEKQTGSFWNFLSIYEWLFAFGALLMLFWFGLKLYHIQSLRKKGVVTYYSDFTKVVMKESSNVFSFFKQIFVGDGIAEDRMPHIMPHEMVHIKQWHTIDLLFFELARICFWCNPLVYVYQNRMAELHEYIADSKVVKENRNTQYQLLLSEVFQTQNLSFVNQFFKKSLIKKRIVMLKKEKSSQFKMFKYLTLLPALVLMLFYTSCETEEKKTENVESTELNTVLKTDLVPFMQVEDVPIFPGCENSEDPRACFIEKIQEHVRKNFNYPKEAEDLGIQGRVAVMFTIDENGDIIDVQKRGPHQLLENEVDRIIQRLPKMGPATHKGKVVKVPFSLPIVFKLQ